jgi:hypothetical protein
MAAHFRRDVLTLSVEEAVVLSAFPPSAFPPSDLRKEVVSASRQSEHPRELATVCHRLAGLSSSMIEACDPSPPFGDSDSRRPIAQSRCGRFWSYA